VTTSTPSFSSIENFALSESFSLAAKKEKFYSSQSTILRAFESLATSFLQTLGVILLFVLLLQPLAPWPSRLASQNHTWKKTFPSSTSHLEKTTSNYDTASGSSLYCNGDPVNGLDADGRCPGKLAAAGTILASAAFGGPAAYQGVNYGTDRLGITDTSSYTDQQKFQYNTQVANLTEGTQGALFALAGARAPANSISYEPMRFEIGTEEPAVISRAIAPSPWPDNAGFIENTIEREFLMPGTTFDRFGFAGGRFVSPTGTPISMRAMRPGTELLPYNNYRVLKPIEVNAGGVMPSFNQRGLGKQYELPVPIRTLEKRGVIENIQNE